MVDLTEALPGQYQPSPDHLQDASGVSTQRLRGIGRIAMKSPEIALKRLRAEGRELPASVRRQYAIRAGRSLLEGTVLREWLDAGELPEGTERVLYAFLFLQRAALSGGDWQRIQDDLERAVAAGAPREAFGPALRAAMEQKHAVALMEGFLDEAGFGFDRDTGRLEMPQSGKGRPRQLYRELVEILLSARESELRRSGALPKAKRISNNIEIRSWIADQLAPFFSDELVDPAVHGALHNTIQNTRRHRR